MVVVSYIQSISFLLIKIIISLSISLGEYRIGLKFNEQHIPDSPFKVYISPAVGDAYLLEVAQFPDSAQVDKPMQFYIRMNGAKGSLDGRVRLMIWNIIILLIMFRSNNCVPTVFNRTPAYSAFELRWPIWKSFEIWA